MKAPIQIQFGIDSEQTWAEGGHRGSKRRGYPPRNRHRRHQTVEAEEKMGNECARREESKRCHEDPIRAENAGQMDRRGHSEKDRLDPIESHRHRPARSEFDGSVGKMDETGPDTSDAVTKVDETNRGNDGQTEERIGAPELTHSNGVGCAMRPRPAKDEDVRPEDPEQVVGVRSVQ